MIKSLKFSISHPPKPFEHFSAAIVSQTRERLVTAGHATGLHTTYLMAVVNSIFRRYEHCHRDNVMQLPNRDLHNRMIHGPALALLQLSLLVASSGAVILPHPAVIRPSVMHPAFESVGKSAGTNVWRIEVRRLCVPNNNSCIWSRGRRVIPIRVRNIKIIIERGPVKRYVITIANHKCTIAVAKFSNNTCKIQSA